MEIFYTRQAILIGTYDRTEEQTSGLLDARRMRNYLKASLDYQCKLLENPSSNDIKDAILTAKEQMNLKVRDCRILIYYSGYTSSYRIQKLYKTIYGYKISAQSEEGDLLDLSQMVIDIGGFPNVVLEENKNGEEQPERQFAEHVHIVYDTIKSIKKNRNIQDSKKSHIWKYMQQDE